MAERATDFYSGIIYGDTGEQIGLIRWVVVGVLDADGNKPPSRVSGYLYVGNPRTSSFAATSFSGLETGVGSGLFAARGVNATSRLVDGKKKLSHLSVEVTGQTAGLQGSGLIRYSLNLREGTWTFAVVSRARSEFVKQIDPTTGQETEVRTDEGEITDQERELADVAENGPEAVQGWFDALMGGASQVSDAIPLWGKVAAGLGFVAWWFKDELFGGKGSQKSTKKRRK